VSTLTVCGVSFWLRPSFAAADVGAVRMYTPVFSVAVPSDRWAVTTTSLSVTDRVPEVAGCSV